MAVVHRWRTGAVQIVLDILVALIWVAIAAVSYLFGYWFIGPLLHRLGWLDWYIYR